MGAFAYGVLSATDAIEVRVDNVGTVNDQRPFCVSVLAEPTSSLFLGRGAAKATVLGLMEKMTADDPGAAGELLDRLVAIVAGEPR